jgi:hypothetical protein
MVAPSAVAVPTRPEPAATPPTEPPPPVAPPSPALAAPPAVAAPAVPAAESRRRGGAAPVKTAGPRRGNRRPERPGSIYKPVSD